jgi:hypothetical protein
LNAGIEPRRGQDMVEVVPDLEVPAMQAAVLPMKEHDAHRNPPADLS